MRIFIFFTLFAIVSLGSANRHVDDEWNVASCFSGCHDTYYARKWNEKLITSYENCVKQVNDVIFA